MYEIAKEKLLKRTTDVFISAGWGAFERNLSSADKQSQSLRQPVHKDCDVYQFQNAQSHVPFFLELGQSPFHHANWQNDPGIESQ